MFSEALGIFDSLEIREVIIAQFSSAVYCGSERDAFLAASFLLRVEVAVSVVCPFDIGIFCLTQVTKRNTIFPIEACGTSRLPHTGGQALVCLKGSVGMRKERTH